MEDAVFSVGVSLNSSVEASVSKSEPANAAATHISDLPDGCLAHVFFLAEGARLEGEGGGRPLACPHMRYASVCRQWCHVARTCVVRLHFGWGPTASRRRRRVVVSQDVSLALRQFPNLAALEFDNCLIEDPSAFFAVIVDAFPLLHSLSLDSVLPPVREKALSHLFLSLPSLRSLSLSHPLHPSYLSPVTLPDSLFLLTCLETLRLANYRFETLPPLFSRLRSLTSLTLSGFRCLAALPEAALAPLRTLVRLHLRDCESLASLPAGLGPLLPALEDLLLASCPALVVDTPLSSLPAALRVLTLDDCVHVRALPSPLPALLERLTVKRCPSLTTLPPVTHLRQLVELTLRHCGALDPPHGEALLGLQGLRHLDLQECARLPPAIFPLRGGRGGTGGAYAGALQALTLGNFPDFETVPEDIGELWTLRNLELRECKWITALPDSIGELSRLRQLRVVSCHRLQQVPPSLGQLQSLEDLAFDDCTALRSVPDSLGRLQALRSLSFASSRLLQCLPGSISRLSKLEVLDLTGCPLVSFYPELQTRLEGSILRKFLDLELPAIGG